MHNESDREDIGQFETRRRYFSKEDDSRIVELVSRYGTDWDLIQSQCPEWSTRQIKDRYRHYLDPSLNLSPWTPEEDKLLIELYHQYGPKWSIICRSFNGRNCVNVKNRWALLCNRKLVTKKPKVLNKPKEQFKGVPIPETVSLLMSIPDTPHWIDQKELLSTAIPIFCRTTGINMF